MKKRLLSLILAVSMLSSLLFALPQVAEAEDLNILDDDGVAITASLTESGTGYSASKMIDGSNSSYFKTKTSWLSNPDRKDLTVTITLPSVQTISGVQILERLVEAQTPCTTDVITVQFGTSSNLQTITTGYLRYPGAGNTEAATYFDFGGSFDGDTLKITFKYTSDAKRKSGISSTVSQYEIYEIEAYRAVDYGVIMYDGSPRARVDGSLGLIDENNESVTPKMNRGKFMAPAAFLANSLGLTFTQTDSGAEFAYNGKSSSLTSSDGVYSENGHIYVPAGKVCEDLGINYESEACGLFFADAEKDVDWNDKKELAAVAAQLRDVVYETAPTPDAVIAQLKANNPSNKHPRLFFSDDMTVAMLKERIQYAPYAAWAKTVISRADRCITNMTSDPIEYEKADGIRLIDVCERVLYDVENLGFAYLMTGDTKYSDKVVEAVMTACAFSDWNPYHFLDVGYMSAAIALGYDWCYDKFTADQRTTVKNALINYALKPVMEDYNEVSSRSRSYKWSSKSTDAYPNNWIAICTGGTIMAVLAIGDEDLGSFTDAGTVVTEGMKRFKDLADTYLPDGGFLDGPDYWEFAMNFIGYTVGTMRTALGTDYGLSDSPGFNTTFDWQAQIEGSMGAFNFDSCDPMYVNSPEFILFGELTDRDDLINHRVNHQLFYTNTASPTFKDILWYDGEDYSSSALPLDYHSKGATNISVLRSGTDADDTWIAMYAGYRKKATDAMQDFDGTFVFDMNGKRWALDYGAESQTYQNTGYVFTDYYVCRPEGHNTVIISESEDSGHDSDACGYIIKSLSNDRMGMAVYDLTDQLDDYGATKWHRGMKLDRGLNKITVQDELTTSSSKPFYWFMHTEAAIEITDGGRGAILTLGEEKVKASLVSSDSSLIFEVREPNPLSTSPNPTNQESREGTRKLTVHSSSVTSVNMAVEFVPYSDGDTVTTETFTPMSSWALKGNGVFVKDSYSDNSGEGEYAAGATVTVNAGERSDAKFAGWVAEGIDLADPSNPTQSFTMPNNSVWLTAKWITTSFFDINFDNWTTHTDLTNADGTSSGSSWNSAVSESGAAVVTDSARTSKGLKLTMNSSMSDYVHLYKLLGSDYQAFPTDQVVWGEFSVKFEGGFTAVGYDHIIGVSPICISSTGAVRRFDENARTSPYKGDKPDMYQLELDKWYHIVWAMDCSKAPEGDGGLLYAWVNGNKILNGTDYSSAFKTAQDGVEYFKNYRLYVEKPSSGTSTVYLDNLKGYATYELDNHAAEDFTIFYPEADYSVENGMFYITGEKKVSDIEDDFNPYGVAITRGGKRLSYNATVKSGDIINITATNGIGFRSLEAVVDGQVSEIEPITASYYDINFENWTNWGDNNFNGGKNSDGSAITHQWGANPWQMTSAEVAEKSGKVMKATIPTSGGDKYLFRSRMTVANQPLDYTNVDVLWNEFSIKYENGFVGFGTNENDSAYSIISVNKNGQLALGTRWGYNEVGTETNFETGTIVPDVQLELGKWYHIAVAADFTDAAATSGVPTYVWVNGELVSDGVTIPSIVPGANWKYNKLWFDQAESTESIAYFDNVKVYETAALDNRAEKDFDINVVFDDSVETFEDQIKIGVASTVADLKGLITADDCTLTFVKDGVALQDSDSAVGAALYVNASNGVGFKCYNLVKAIVAPAARRYFDINFENWTEWGDNKFNGGNNSDGLAISHEWAANPWQMTSATVSDRAGKVMKATIPTSGGSNYLFRSRMKAADHPSDYTNVDVLWNEFSIKYENGFVGFGTNENDSAYSIISINKNGQLALGSRWGYNEVGTETNFEAGTIVPDVQLELGKWYHIAVAADFTDANATSGVPTYIWVNGEKVSEGITIPSIVPGANWAYNKLWFDQAESVESTVYIDNIKVYETAILDDHAQADFDINVAFDESLEVNENQVTVPADATVADVKGLVTAAGCGFAFVKDGEVLAESDLASGATLYVNGANGIGYKCYSLVAEEIVIPDEPGNTPEITNSYYDIDFENWTNWGDNKFNGGNNSDGSAISHEWGANPWQMTSATVSDRAGTVMQANIPTSGGSNYMFRSRMKVANQPSDYTNVDVLWNEFSIKYEGGFIGFGTNENDHAYSIISINKNGQLALGARWGYNEVGGEGSFEAGTIVPGVQLELGKWYDIKVAANFADENASSGVPAYVWVNDELVANGTVIASVVPGTGWVYNKLYFDQAETEGSVAYIDDIKVYETAELGEIIVPDEPDPEPDPEPEDPEIPVVPDIDNSDSKTKTYFSIGFENWTEWGDNKFNGGNNSDGSAISHEWGANPWQMTSATVSDRAGKVMKATIPTSGGSNYLFRSRMKAADHPSDYTNVDVLWNEFSIKYENGFVGFGTNENDSAYSIISVNKNGQLALGARWAYNEVGGGNFEAGTIVPGVQLELGKWYNIAVAADFTDANASAGVPVYVWVNGELISEGITIPSIVPGANWAYNKFYFDQAESVESIVYIDDVEVYETAEVGNGIGQKINVMTDALNSITANISTRNEEFHSIPTMADGSKSSDDMYKSLKTSAEQDGLKVVAALDAVYKISSVTVSERWMGDQGLTVSVEIGKNGNLTKVVDNQAVNKGSEGGACVETTYNFAASEGDTIVYTFKAATHRPEESDYQIYELEALGSYVEDVTQTGFAPETGFWYHNSNDAIDSYYINCNNAGDEDINGKLFIAAYKDNKLVKLTEAKAVTVKKGANTLSCTETDGIYDSTLTYKVFMWDGIGTLKPVAASADIR